jgi:superoxide dismutase
MRLILHEVFFDGLAGLASPPPTLPAFASAIERNFGGQMRWATDHAMTLAGGTPLLAHDMYEHAYAIDYCAKAADYVDTRLKIAKWDAASRRYDRLTSPA